MSRDDGGYLAGIEGVWWRQRSRGVRGRYSGFWLYRKLVAAGIDCIVVHAASIEVSARDKVKTDNRDSLKIAQQLAAGRLRGVRVPTEEEEQQRLLTRIGMLRDEWVELAKRIKEIDRLLVEQAKQDPLDAVYRSVPGVGPLISRILSAELGDSNVTLIFGLRNQTLASSRLPLLRAALTSLWSAAARPR